jgi:hypothetical protein
MMAPMVQCVHKRTTIEGFVVGALAGARELMALARAGKIKPTPMKEEPMPDSRFVFSLRNDRFYDTRGRVGFYNAGKAEACPTQKGVIFCFGTFLPANLGKHSHIEHFSRMRFVARRQHHLDNQQTAGRFHGLAYIS